MASTIICAVIPGPPQSKERPRASKSGRFYTPQATKDAEQSIAEHLITQNREAVMDPKARFKVDIHYYQTSRRTDIDNEVKATLDGITMSRIVWNTDAQVDALYAIRTTPNAEGERTELWITAL